MPMRLLPLRPSTNIQAASYDEESLDLLVNFKSGSTYVYHRVPTLTASGLIQANSPGKYLNEVLVKNPSQFPYERVS